MEWLIDDVLRHLLRKRTNVKNTAKLDMHTFNTITMKRRRTHNKKDNALKPTSKDPPSNNYNLKKATQLTTNNQSITFPRRPIDTENYKRNMGASGSSEVTGHYDRRQKTPFKHIRQPKSITESFSKNKHFSTSSQLSEKEIVL